MECSECKYCKKWFPKYKARNGIVKEFCSEPCRNAYWKKKGPATVKKEEKIMSQHETQKLSEMFY